MRSSAGQSRGRVPMRLQGWRQALAGGCLFLVFLLSLLPATSVAQAAIPALETRVTDLAGVLDASQRATLEKTLADIEARKGAQVAVLIVQTTGPEPIEQYSMRVAEAWKLGRGKVDGRRVDDGALLLVAVKDRRTRLEVGYGL
ncbi:MAG: TPM domain-containing protein, partial [Burkholderiaceae bacterium]